MAVQNDLLTNQCLLFFIVASKLRDITTYDVFFMDILVSIAIVAFIWKLKKNTRIHNKVNIKNIFAPGYLRKQKPLGNIVKQILQYLEVSQSYISKEQTFCQYWKSVNRKSFIHTVRELATRKENKLFFKKIFVCVLATSPKTPTTSRSIQDGYNEYQ